MDEAILAKIEAIEAEDNRQNHRLAVLEDEVKNIREIAVSIKELTLEIKHLREDVQAQSARLDKIENAPLRNLETIKNVAVSTVVSGILGVVMGIIISALKNGG